MDEYSVKRKKKLNEHVGTQTCRPLYITATPPGIPDPICQGLGTSVTVGGEDEAQFL